MKDFKQLLSKKVITNAPRALDEKSIFYVFDIVIKEEYGRQGGENVKAVFYKDHKIFIKATGSTWASEIWLNREMIVRKINAQLGSDEISDLAMAN